MSPDEYNKQVLGELVAIHKNTDEILKLMRAGARMAQSGNGPSVASDADLDGQYGNEPYRFDPKEKYWEGDSFIGCRPSECSVDYLDAQAKYLDACAFMARKNGDDKKAGYKEKDAARARGWAKRLRGGWGGDSANAAPRRESSNGGGGGAPRQPVGGFSDESEYAPSDDDIPFISSAPGRFGL